MPTSPRTKTFCVRSISSDHTLTEVSRLRIPVSDASIVGISIGLFCLAFQRLIMHKPNPNDGKNGLTWVFEIYL